MVNMVISTGTSFPIFKRLDRNGEVSRRHCESPFKYLCLTLKQYAMKPPEPLTFPVSLAAVHLLHLKSGAASIKGQPLRRAD